MFEVRVCLAPFELVSDNVFLKEGNQSHTFEILNKWQTSMWLLFAAGYIWLSPCRFQNGGCDTGPGIVYIITNVWIASEIRFDIFLLFFTTPAPQPPYWPCEWWSLLYYNQLYYNFPAPFCPPTELAQRPVMIESLELASIGLVWKKVYLVYLKIRSLNCQLLTSK